ncbi:MAG: hypothetical protein AB1512_26135 [Thermodesulfobacteriota bacterium]
MKTYRVICAECKEPFYARFEPVDDAAEGTGEETVTCMYCQKQVVIPIPRKYQKTDVLIRSRSLSPA